jgi:short-subunit dehydrogenase
MPVAIVTGGTSGLGAAIAAQLESRGFTVVTVSRRESASVRGDASRAETAQKAIATAEQLGQLTLLVNCAGAGSFGPAGSYGEETIRALIDANLISMIVFSDALFRRFAEHGGTIVNVLSTAAFVAKPNESVYCAAKWGARGYSDVLKAEAKGTRLRVISVAPGGMDTAFWPERKANFMDAREVAKVIADAVERPVNLSSIVIERT